LPSQDKGLPGVGADSGLTRAVGAPSPTAHETRRICSTESPPLSHRVQPANSAAFPPAAVVLTVTVCSAQKRYR
jgi:hypothetical protein